MPVWPKVPLRGGNSFSTRQRGTGYDEEAKAPLRGRSALPPIAVVWLGCLNVRLVPIADINHHLFSAVACVKASYVYEQAIWLMGPPG